MTVRLKIWLGYLSAVLATGVCVGTGFIPRWGEWYSSSPWYRLQTDAFFRGQLALSSSPADIAFDLVWGEGGVHQAWGLGVPMWRLPFEMMALLLGQPAFPDRIALASAMVLLTFLLLKAFTTEIAAKHVAEWYAQMKRAPTHLMAVLVLLLFPPMLTFLAGTIQVYEEAVAYTYLFSIGLFAGLVILWARPTGA